MRNEKEKECGVCKIPYFERNNYFYGKLMTVRDFSAEQCYFNEKRWLVNRMVIGWGVVCGLDVKQKPIDPNDPSKGYDGKKAVVTSGLAIDCCGREILVCEEQEIQLIPEESECHKEKKEEQQREQELVICLEYHECKTEPIPLPPIACDQKEKCEFNRIRDSFKISVIPLPKQISQPEPFCPQTEDEKKKSLHRYLCDRLRKGCPKCPDPQCIILAIVTVDKDGNLKGKIDTCSHRKLVYNNPLLYDLINCFHGDLPHVIEINWKKNGATIPWEDFKSGIYTDGVKVWFDQKMNGNTINANTFLFMVKMEDPETGNSKYEQVPGSISYNYDAGGSIATFTIESAWLEDVYFGYSTIREKGGEFMVVLRGDFIMSVEENGRPAKALDGNFIGGKLPSGNGTPGDDFISWFFVGPKTEVEGEKKRRR